MRFVLVDMPLPKIQGPDLAGVVAAGALVTTLRGRELRVAGLSSLVGFKRLAGRTQDRADLEALERVNGELPIEPIPGLDS